MAIDFPIPENVGFVFIDETTGNYYTCAAVGPPAVWVCGDGGGGDPSSYVTLDTAQTITGDKFFEPGLDVGGAVASPNITLDATGTASFGGDVTVSNSNTNGQTVVGKDGALQITRVTSNTDTAFSIVAGGDENIAFTAAGSATFDDSANIGPIDLSAGEASGITLSKNGTVYVQNSTAAAQGSASSFVCQYGTASVIEFKSDGSAVFDGSEASSPVRISKYGSLLVASDTDTLSDARFSVDGGNGDVAFVGTLKKNTSAGSLVCALDDDYLRIYDGPQSLDDFEISLNSDGSAAFEGDVAIGPNTTGTVTADESVVYVGKEGYLTLFHDSSDPSIKFIDCKVLDAGGGTPTTKFSVDHDGSATFGNDPTTTASNGIKLAGSTGAISARRTADPTNYLFAGYSTVSGNTPVAYISADGSAAFKGTIVVGDNTNGYTAPGVYLAKEGYVAVSNSTGGTAIWQGFNGTSTETSSINADGSASFDGQVSTISAYAQYSVITTETTSNTGVFIGSSSSTNPTGDNSNIHLQGDGGMLQRATGNGAYVRNQYHADRDEAQSALVTFEGWWDGNKVSQIALASGDDTTGHDDGIIQFFASPDGDTITETARFYAGGKANFGATSFITTDTNFQVTSTGAVKLMLASPGNRSFSLGVNSVGNFNIVDESSNVSRMVIDPSGNVNFGGDVEVTGDLTTSDLVMSNIHHDRGNEVDGTHGHWCFQEGADGIFVINRITGKRYSMALTPID